MGGREEVNLKAEEQAMLAQLEARAAQDRRLVRLLDSRRHHRRLRLQGLPGWLCNPLWAIPVLVAGLAMTLLSLSTSPEVGWVGILMTTAGLWRITSALGRRWSPKSLLVTPKRPDTG